LLYLSAIILGFAFGIKYSAGFYILALSPLIILTAYSGQPSWGKALKSLIFSSLLFLCAISPWLLKNWILLKSPIYPFFTGVLPQLEMECSAV
jgi:4-amino-4-deoxy-L-arabinose transferase-like glycosyltransferase